MARVIQTHSSTVQKICGTLGSSGILPDFSFSDSFLDILVSGAAALLSRRRRMHRRGKRAGALVKFRQRGLRTPLPSIHMTNLRSLRNKMDELSLLNRTNKDFSLSAVLCFTETWLADSVPDSALHLHGFHLHRADRDTELSGKEKGGGICFYINQGWCTDVTVLMRICSPNLESLFLNCTPFYCPREFSSAVLVAVYVPPQACTRDALIRSSAWSTNTQTLFLSS